MAAIGSTGGQQAATNQLGALPFGNLIGGPLNAAIEAQANAAMSTRDFIEAVGFDNENNVINITLLYKNGGVTRELVVPLLTILPIPYLRIDDMTIQFKANINATSQAAQETKSSLSADSSVKASASYWFAKAEMSASVSSKKDSTASSDSKYSVEYTMDVYVHAVQDDIPAGMAKVLNMLTENIEPSIQLGQAVTVPDVSNMNSIQAIRNYIQNAGFNPIIVDGRSPDEKALDRPKVGTQVPDVGVTADTGTEITVNIIHDSGP